MSFCPSCGKKTEKSFCDACRPTEELVVKDISIKLCIFCKSHMHKNRWAVTRHLKETLEKLARDNIKDNKTLKLNAIIPNIRYNPGLSEKFELEVTRDSEVFIVPGIIMMTQCDNCTKQQGEYTEGTLQLRNINEEILNFVYKFGKENNFFITKTSRISDGYDLDITDQKKIQTLGHQLEKYYGGILKVSPRLFSKDHSTGKDVYRVNVYYEAPDYKKGDVIKIGRALILITSIRDTLTGIDLKTEKKTTIDMKNKEYTLLKQKDATVSRIHPHVEAIELETYQSIKIQNAKEVKIDETIKVVDDDGLFYVV
jgi:NMD protein affecting ribosome stability and mRNA decay